MYEIKYQNYSISNYLAFNYAGLACIAIVVFLTATQPFYIKEVIGIKPKPGSTNDTKIGHIVGLLGFFDEVTAMISAPLIGGFIDKLDALGYGGSKIVQSSSFIFIALALFGYAAINQKLVPDMFIFRCIFALGVTACMSTVTVTLNELSTSDFSLKKLIFWKKNEDYHQVVEQSQSVTLKRKNGAFAGIMGICTGLGAIFSVAVFIPLPITLSNWRDIGIKQSIQDSYVIVMIFAAISMVVLYFGLYDTRSDNAQSSSGAESIGNEKSFLTILSEGLQFSRGNKNAQLACAGAFVARATTVVTTAFIPLLVYNYYYSIGKCESNSWSEKDGCYEGYRFAAMLNGIAQTAALVSAPVWGYLVNKYGKKSIGFASAVGAVGNLALSANFHYETYNPKTASCFLFVCIIGLSQIGLIISSMSCLSGIPDTHSIMGSLSGLYTFSGGLGIMMITLLGGFIADSWILGPFFLLGVFNIVLLVVYFLASKESAKLALDESEDPLAP
ncbi:uncharacterized protein LODBEIA_P07580 [Lodderomyces beijingensis]|uniref:Major facilitator superfamily (MFS) profile domain-containing protein n=1 Tax=Lodderomyces beijingensis TaxID=1775926 RepID=A0ABP0ZEF1_9ASCO